MNDWSDAERRVEKAQQFFEQRKWSECSGKFKPPPGSIPTIRTWFFNMGLILDEMGRYEEALDAYIRARDIDPHDLHTLYHLGVDLYRIGQIDRSIETFKQIESLDATFEPSYCNRIIAYAQKGEHELAEEMFYTARLYKEHCPQCYYNIGCSLEVARLI